MREWTRVAQVIKPKNLQGCLVVRSDAGLPFLLEEGMEVAFVPPQIDCPRLSTVVSISEYKTQDYLVTFEGVDDIDTAEKLAGGYCLVKTADLADDWELLQEETIVGFRVMDQEYGEIGSVVDFVELPLQSHLLVQGRFGEVVIPFVEEYVLEIHDTDQTITTRLSKGILELGTKAQSLEHLDEFGNDLNDEQVKTSNFIPSSEQDEQC